MKRGLVLSLAFSVAGVLFVPRHAQAFEREWHMGGGLGFTAYPRYYSVGPALGLNGSYGLSDVFDLKLELLGSYHSYPGERPLPSQWAAPLSVVSGLSYKLDVLQWIPYAALLVGVQHLYGALPLGQPFRRTDALAALMVGVDYAMTRNFGLGLSLRTDLLFSTPSQGQAITTLLRAEYHWGF